jgi:hypothetical protein
MSDDDDDSRNSDFVVDKDSNEYDKQGVYKRVRQLKAECDELKRENKRLKSELRKAQTKSGRLTKIGMMTYNDWNAQEAQLSEIVSSFCGSYLFRRYKFLHDGWETFDLEDGNSLSSFFKRKLPSGNSDDYEDHWDRIYVPTICSKYKTLRCNLNNAIREQYKGKLCVSEN